MTYINRKEQNKFQTCLFFCVCHLNFLLVRKQRKEVVKQTFLFVLFGQMEKPRVNLALRLQLIHSYKHASKVSNIVFAILISML